MKKIITSVLALAMIVTMLFTFVACSSYNAIKSDFEDAGWTLLNEDDEKTGEIQTDDGVITYTIHTFQPESEGGLLGGIVSTAKTAIVWEFSSDKDLEKAIGESETLKGLISDAQNSEYVNGNCVLTSFSGEAKDIFNKSK